MLEPGIEPETSHSAVRTKRSRKVLCTVNTAGVTVLVVGSVIALFVFTGPQYNIVKLANVADQTPNCISSLRN
jgi:hypothetical protein